MASENAEINPNKRARQDSSILSGDVSKLNDLLDSSKQSLLHFKNALAGGFVSEITSLRNELNDVKIKLDEMEQYSRRNCLKIAGIPEEKDENTDTLVSNVIINLILKENTEKNVDQ